MQQPPHLSAPVTSCIPLPGPGGADSQCPAQPCCCQEVPALLPETPGLAQPLCQQLEGWAEPCQPLFQLQFRWSQRVIFILILPIPLTVILPTAQAVAKVSGGTSVCSLENCLVAGLLQGCPDTSLWTYSMAVFDLFVLVVLLKGCLARGDWGRCCNTLVSGCPVAEPNV